MEQNWNGRSFEFRSVRLRFQNVPFQNIQEFFHTCEIFTDLLWDTATGLVKKKKKKFPKMSPAQKGKTTVVVAHIYRQIKPLFRNGVK